MSYVSEGFFVFLLVFFIAYFIFPKRFQWVCLLIASYGFYLLVDWQAAAYIVVTTVTVFFLAKLIWRLEQRHKQRLAVVKETAGREEKQRMKAANTRKKRWVLAAGLLLNFGILGVLKYGNFTVDAYNGLMGLFGRETRAEYLSLLLPLGISFYTFQAMGYLIDVYRNKVEPCGNLAKFALFISFFPQIMQGPISRYDQLAPQLFAPHAFDYTQFKFGLQRVLWGYFKKLVIADRAAYLVSFLLADYAEYSGFVVAVGVFVFMMQVYTDFSGGIDISLGIAQSCGIQMTENFMRPHFAQSVPEYWRRWHITLGAWMKDYLLYPLSLSKAFSRLGKRTRKWFGNYWGKQIPTCIAMGIVFLMVGIWHGAHMKYIAFGVYNGGLIILGILISPIISRYNEKYHWVDTKSFSWTLFKILGTMFLVFIGKYFAMTETVTVAWEMIKATFSSFNPWIFVDGTLFELGLSQNNVLLLFAALQVLLVVSLLQERGIKLRETIARQNIVFRWTLYLLAIVAVVIFGVYGYSVEPVDFFYQNI